MTDSAPASGETPISPSFPIVGLGASAGGLEALTEFVKGVTLDSMAFVVVQHLSPNHETLLPQILGRVSHIPVLAIADGMRVEANHIYVAPPNASVGLLHGVFLLMSPSSPLPIDHFFRALAEDQGQKAIGVILSGMGSDGVQGLREIKARGGLAFAQDPATARFESMPRSAQQAGVVDRVLSPEAIAAELMTMSHHAYLGRTPANKAPVEREAMGKLFILIRSAHGTDLSLYKSATIDRRVERRMLVNQIDTLVDYVRYAQEHPQEVSALYRDVLIGVTSFFRDAGSFEAIKQVALPPILERRTGASPIRLWVPACASGEEAYSLGICLLEALDRASVSRRVQIFGTDIDEEAIARARRGIYPTNIEADVSKERLERFFTKAGEGYQVSRRLRELVVFSPQNIATDSPFSRIDLASCRNLLIYLQPLLQKRVLRLLHYALVPDGTLMLGGSETVGDCVDLFSLVDRKYKIYVKKNLPLSAVLDHEIGPEAHRSEVAQVPSRERRAGPTAQQIADRKLVERYGPPSILVNENLDVLQFRGDTGPYFSPAPGAATLNLMKLLRPELQVEVWRVVQQVMKMNLPGRVEPLRLSSHDGDESAVALDVMPIHEAESNSRCLLIVFEDQKLDGSTPRAGSKVEPPDVPEQRVRYLEQELDATKEYLQSTIEELETSNEELKATNEELQSTNEELQSTNEELETSKEELQSTNEELSTINDELQNRMTDLARTSGDLDNLLLSVPDPILFVNGELRVGRMSDSAQRLLQLGKGDIGRPLLQLKGLFVPADIEQLVRNTMQRLVIGIEQIRVGDRWHELRVVPYRSSGGVLDGVLVFLRDIEVEKRRQGLVIDVEAYAAKVLAALPQPLAIVDLQLRVLWVNAPFLSMFHVDAHATVGNLFQNLGSGQWAHPKLRAAMERAFATGQGFLDFRIEHEFESIGRQTMSVSGTAVSGVGGSERVLIITIVPYDASDRTGERGENVSGETP